MTPQPDYGDRRDWGAERNAIDAIQNEWLNNRITDREFWAQVTAVREAGQAKAAAA